ncbi:hypothetical protein D9611_013740 [Ephemerocybe angulata]|uniref:CHAT domain-containing protein n=1 Tax=Ephemerocybe angulata TaxID=980116 RepID=A0A8H5BCP3_9AGAR|nr:hypothetical protein D9611_013740 [Tulosesus angulatus]
MAQKRNGTPGERPTNVARPLIITDILVDHTDDFNRYGRTLNLVELWIAGFPAWPGGKCFVLTHSSSLHWERIGLIELLACIVKREDGTNIGLAHLDIAKMRASKASGLRQKMNTCDPQMALTISLEIGEKPFKTSPEVDSAHATRLYESGMERLHAFHQRDDPSDITEALLILRRAVECTTDSHEHRPVMLLNLGIALNMRSNLTGSLSDLSEAIALQKKAIALTAEAHPFMLTNLGLALRSRFQHTGERSDLDESISMQRRAVDGTPRDDVNLPSMLTNLGVALKGLFKQTGSSSFECRFERTGDLSDISGAISAYQKAVNLSPRGDKELPPRLANVGSSLHRYFERTGDLSHIEEAIEAKRKAAKLIPQGSPDQYAILSNLGNSLRFRFERTGELTDINEAIALQREARDSTPEGHAKYPIMLNNLGLSLRSRFDRTGDLSDISEAIAGQQKAVGVTPRKHPELPTFLNDLGVFLNCRFERTGEVADVSEAISVQRKAVDITAENHADLPSRLTSLGSSLSRRFERTGELPDISEAISVQKRAIELTPTDHASLIVMFQDLGNSYTFSFEQTRNISDINESIKAYKKVVDLTPEGHPNIPSQLANLGSSLSRRSEQTKDISGVSEAISVQQRALKLSPPGYSATPGIHSNLAFSYRRRFSWGKTDADLGEAIFHYQAAATSPSGSPQVKLTAAAAWARLLRLHYPRSTETLHAFDVAIGLTTLIAGLEQTVRGRHAQLQTTSGIALEAAAAACGTDRADMALERLEQGRCLVWNQLNNLRTPLSDLQICNGPLAQVIREVSKQLETAGSSRTQRDISMHISEKVTVEDEAHAHLKLAKRWDDLLMEARAIPGFESFLKPIPCSTLLQNLPESGPVVVINLDGNRCDAIALLAGLNEPVHVHLPNFSIELASKYRADLDRQLMSHHLRVRGEEKGDEGRGIRSAPIGKFGQLGLPVHQVLRGLWEYVVKPVLDALAISQKAKNTHAQVLPRIWWCPTGPLSFLPLHAAGIYSQANDAESALDYVVSSYTPTVTAIVDRVKNCRGIDTKASGLFLTSQPSAPGASSIHGTTREVRAIFTRAKEHAVRVLKLEGDEMSVDRCVESMLDFSSIHLACHGSQNAAEPLQSRFIFHRGSLELGTILKSDLKNADLAFLSACQTSTGDEKISDEAVHLAAGMLAAGYRRVVATMWSIGDRPAQEVATDFYDFIFSRRKGDSGDTFDATLSAHALHHATQQLRQRLDNSEHSLLAWVPFVHFGY